VCGGEVIQRADDVADAIAERLHAYEQETKPLLDHYQTRRLLTHVDGQGTTDEVFERLCAVIDGSVHA
jgi:adenylate kinase